MTQRCVHTSTPPSTRLWVLRSMWRCFDLRVRTSGGWDQFAVWSAMGQAAASSFWAVSKCKS